MSHAPDSRLPRVTVLTGATGFVGQELLGRILARSTDERLVLPIRSSSGRTARERADVLLERVVSDPETRRKAAERIEVVETDLGSDEAWRPDEVLARTAGAPCRVIHGAATVSFDLPIELARAVNVAGTRRMLDLAEALHARGRLEHFAYVSTAFVAGERSGTAFEHELDMGQGFSNTYERTKFEAESLAQERAKGLPVSIYRPSIVAGHSETGETSDFKVLYWPLKVLARGLVPLFPARLDACYDIVPVDFVAESLLRVLDTDPPAGSTFHLTAARTITMAQLMDIATELFGCRRPLIVSPRVFTSFLRPLLELVLWGRPREVVLRTGLIYYPYFVKALRFDHTNTAAALADQGLAIPDTEAYVRSIIRYARDTDFGRTQDAPLASPPYVLERTAASTAGPKPSDE